MLLDQVHARKDMVYGAIAGYPGADAASDIAARQEAVAIQFAVLGASDA